MPGHPSRSVDYLYTKDMATQMGAPRGNVAPITPVAVSNPEG
jgi:hypothetical protein